MNQHLHQHRTLLLSALIMTAAIGMLALVARASDDTSEANHRLFLPAITYRQPPYWEPVATPQRPTNSLTKFFDLALCGGHAFAGSNEGLYRLEGGQWRRFENIPANQIVAGVTFRDNNCAEAYATTYGRGIWRGRVRPNGDWDWGRIDADGDADNAARYVLVAEDKLFIAGDFGIRWSAFPTGEQSFDWQTTNVTATTISITNNNGRLMAAVWNDGVYEWRNQTWVKIAGQPLDPLIYRSVIFASGLVAGTQSGLYYVPAGGNWQLMDSPPEETVYALFIHKGVLYVGQRGSPVYRSADGINWQPLPKFPDERPDGALGFQVRGFAVGGGGALHAATTSGVWRLVEAAP